jgi:hypothetical protein
MMLQESGWVPVVHTCNPSFSEGRDQEDRNSKPVQANSSQDPSLETPNTKMDWQSSPSGRPPA